LRQCWAGAEQRADAATVERLILEMRVVGGGKIVASRPHHASENPD
jgi:hypothetical protein